MAEEQFTFKVKGWDATDIDPVTFDEKLKQCARENFEWTDTIPNPDPDSGEETIVNPETHIYAIFIKKPLADFWIWFDAQQAAEQKVEREERIEGKKSQASVEIISEE